MIHEDKEIGSRFTLKAGDCLRVLKDMEGDSIDSLVTDPPAGISFMGKIWDSNKGGRDGWISWLCSVMQECLRVMKPGAHGLVWAIPRTSHWTGTALENAGFEIRDVVTHLFGSGFPKSLDISKAIDKAAGVKRKTDAAKQWQGYGTALKPASEHWILIRKPISEKTIAANVLKWGVGGLNIDGTRISVNADEPNKRKDTGGYVKTESRAVTKNAPYNSSMAATLTQGRVPANLVLSCSDNCTEDAHDIFECPIALLDEQSGFTGEPLRIEKVEKSIWGGTGSFKGVRGHGASGGASRFFYCAKASKSDKNAGLEGMPVKASGAYGEFAGDGRGRQVEHQPRENFHPTVKSTKLMSYLIKLITPPNGIVLDPFTGSGSTGVAALKEGFRFVGIEQEPEYIEIAKKRIEHQAKDAS